MSYSAVEQDPQYPFRSVVIRFLESGAPNLNIDPGGGSPATFDIDIPVIGGLPALAVTRVSLVLVDPGTMSPTNFGSGAALPNGLALRTTLEGLTTTITCMQDNLDILTCFTGGQGQSGFPGQGADFGLFNTADWIGGAMLFDTPLRLETGDELFFEVADDLTGIQAIRAACFGQFVR